jgi:translation initiation factor 2 subunit 2
MSELVYEQLLDRALKQIPNKQLKYERFEIPKSEIIMEGNKTIIINFKEIYTILNREPKHIAKFIMKEVGSAGDIDDSRLTLHGKFSRQTINKVIEEYTKLYVICPICGKADTFIKKEERLTYLICGACGATSSLRRI